MPGRDRIGAQSTSDEGREGGRKDDRKGRTVFLSLVRSAVSLTRATQLFFFVWDTSKTSKALCHERFPLCKTREREQKTPDRSSGKSLKP